MNRIQTIIDKEWAEVFKNRLVIFTITLLPLLFTILPLVFLHFTQTSGVSGSSSSDMPASFAAACQSASTQDCIQIYLIDEFLILFIMMPVIIPITIAAYSIVGEKTSHSLEPLLATPISTQELLAGKSLAAAIPGILATWVCFAIFLLLAPLAGASQGVMSYLLSATWILAIGVIGPLLAILSVNLALYVSSRVNDPRVAEQISAVIVLPILLVLIGELTGIIILNVTFMLLSILVLVIFDVAMIYLGSSIFQRETILTRWK